MMFQKKILLIALVNIGIAGSVSAAQNTPVTKNQETQQHVKKFWQNQARLALAAANANDFYFTKEKKAKIWCDAYRSYALTLRAKGFEITESTFIIIDPEWGGINRRMLKQELSALGPVQAQPNVTKSSTPVSKNTNSKQ